jgi:hypothetical protein
MTTDDHGGRVTSSLNDVARIRGQGDQGTMIVGGITYPRVVAAGVSIWRFRSGHRRLPVMMNDGDSGTIDGGAIKGGV